MARLEHNVLGVLRYELNFLERGGYGRSERTPWRPATIFLDSLACPNFQWKREPGPWQASRQARPCSECALFQFVPPQSRHEAEPCHHIPLNETGLTLVSMDRGYNQHEMEEAVAGWLRTTIDRIETEAAEQQYELAALSCA